MRFPWLRISEKLHVSYICRAPLTELEASSCYFSYMLLSMGSIVSSDSSHQYGTVASTVCVFKNF